MTQDMNIQQARLAQMREEKQARLNSGVLIVVKTFYHQLGGMDPVSADTRYTRNLQTDEQPYVRHLSLSQETGWVPIDAGWLNAVGASYIRVKNNEGTRFQRYPTPEEKADVIKRIVDISFDGINAHIPVIPGEAQEFTPTDLSLIRLRCQYGTAKISINIVPK